MTRKTTIIVVVALACAAACARLAKPRPAAAVVLERPKVASPQAAWLAHALYYTLSEKLREIEGLRLVRSTSAHYRLSRIVRATCRVDGEKLTVELEAADPATNAVVIQRTLSGSEAEVLEVVARVVQAVLDALNSRVILWDGKPFIQPAPRGERLDLPRHVAKGRCCGTRSPAAFVAFWKAVAASNPADRRRWLDAATSADPDFARPYLLRGILHYRAGEHSAAVSDLRRALALGLRTPELFYTLGLALTETGHPDEGLRALDQALALRPEDPRILVARALASLRRGHYGDAITEASRAIELAPSLVEARLTRGTARLEAGDREGAIADFAAALDLDPDCLEALTRRGCAYYASGKHAAAIADFSKALSLDGDNLVALRGRGLARYAQGDREGAIADLTRAIALEPNHPLAYYGRALALAASGKHAAALRDALAARARGGKVPRDFIEALERRVGGKGGAALEEAAPRR